MSEVNRTPDLLTALAERLSMTLARQATALEQINRTEWEAIAREALAFVAERLPKTPADVIAMMPPGTVVCEEPWNGSLLIFLRDLRGRLGVEP